MWCDNYRWNFDYARLAYDAGFSFENQKHQTNLDLSKIGKIRGKRSINCCTPIIFLSLN